MKTNNSTFTMLVFAAFLFSISCFAQQKKDTTQIRYLKFATTVNSSYDRIALQELKAFSEGVNVAAGNTITASSSTYDNNTGAVVDGNDVTSWFSDDYTTLTNDMGVGPTDQYPHFIVVDLGSKYNLESLKLDLGGGGWSFDYTFDFSISEDSVNWVLVDSKIKTHDVYTYTNVPIQNVRYIKYACYYSSDWGQVNVQEIQAYVGGVNVALNKKVYANSYEWGDAQSNGKNVVDGNSGTRWSSNRNNHVSGPRAATAPIIVTVDLGAVQTIDSLQLTYNSSTIFNLSVSTDKNEWLQIDQRLNDKNNYTYILNRSIALSSSILAFAGSSATCKTTISSNGGSDITARGICWSTSPSPTVENSKTSNGTGMGSFLATLTGLVDNTVYYVRAYATNATETKYSKEMSFLAGLTIQTDVITNASYSIATSGGYVTAIDGIEVTNKGVCWSTGASPTIDAAYSSEGSGAGEFTSNLTGLTGGTKYYVRAYATTNLGTFYGNEYNFKYLKKQYQANGDGYFPNEIFSEEGTANDQNYYVSKNGNNLYFDGYSWAISGFVTTSDSGNPPLTGWWDGTVFTLITPPNPAVSYDKSSLKECSFNNGSFKETLAVTHDNANGATFSGVDNEDFIETGKAIIRNLPAGLTAHLVRNNSLSLTLSLTGKATAHAKANDVSNVRIMLAPQAFSNGTTVLTNGIFKTFSLSFIEPVDITVTGTKTCSDYSICTETNVTIDNNSALTINNATSANQLILNPGAKLNLGNSVTVNDVILKADDANSFSAKLSSGMTVNGTLLFEKTMLDTKLYFLSFPCDVHVTDITMNGGGTLDEDYYILTYDGANRATNGPNANWSHVTSGTLTAKKGYAFGLKSGSGTKTLSFVLNKSIIESENEMTVPATFYDGSLGNNHKGWNLIGQPYLSKFAGSDVGMNYLTTWDGNAYTGQVKNLVSGLNPFEAFLVQVPDSNPISFDFAGRQAVRSLVSQNLQEGLQLNMTNTSGTDFSTLIFDNEQSTDYVIGQDLEKWLSTSTDKPQIYSILNGINFAYNALPINNAGNLPIGYYSKNGGASTISASNVNVSGLSKLLLTDSQTGTTTDLLTEAYNFNADAGTNNARLTLTPQRISTNVSISSVNNAPFAYIKNSILKISNLPVDATIRIYDATGRMCINKNVSETGTYEVPLKSAGMYVIQINTNTTNWNYKLTNK